MEKKKFKDLTIRDAFLFAAVMTDREICRIPTSFLSVILIRSEKGFTAITPVPIVKRQAR